jgi:hypothetical protein
VAVGLLLVRGLGAVLSEPSPGGAASAKGGQIDDPALDAFAVRFARLYLEAPSSQELTSLFAPGSAPPSTASVTARGVGVRQAEVAGARGLGDGRAIVTVACQLDRGGTLYLAVPIVRESAAEVAAQGVPAVVAGPAPATAGAEPIRPLAGPEAGDIAGLARRFLPAYLAARSGADISYLLAPGAQVTPPGGGLSVSTVTAVKQLGDGEGARRRVIATVLARGPLGARYELAYRLLVVRRGRWYIERVEGALS